MREKLKKFGAEEILERAELYGRTFVDENKEKLYFNWSLSGFEVDFCGTCLEAELECLPDSRPEDVPAEGIMEKKTVMVEDWPWIQVVLDGERRLIRSFFWTEKVRELCFSLPIKWNITGFAW